MGGDDITEFLLALLERVHFPYRDASLSRSYDWELIEDLKGKICTLSEVSTIYCPPIYFPPPPTGPSSPGPGC